MEKYRPGERLFDFVKDASFGAFFSYEQLAEIIGKDPQEEGRSIIHGVRRRLLRSRQKLLLVNVGKGYYIAHPDEHVAEANKLSREGDRKKLKALETTVFVDASKLNNEQIKKLADEQVKLRLEIYTRRKIESAKVERKVFGIPTGEELLGVIIKKKA
jgi:hypothetical protein